MAEQIRGWRGANLFVAVLSVVNTLLALNFFPLVPLLGWAYYGHAGWVTAWIPDAVILLALPAAYQIYWRHGPIIAGAALALCVWRREGRVWVIVNGATIALWLFVRIAMYLLGIRSDVV